MAFPKCIASVHRPEAHLQLPQSSLSVTSITGCLGSGRVTAPGRFQEKSTCGAEGHGSWAWWGWVDKLYDLKRSFPTLMIQ